MGNQMKFKFRKNNKTIYFQDFDVHRGIPSGIEFEFVINPFDHTKGHLKADGYGCIDGNYGNGALFVFVEHLPRRMQKLLKKDGII